MKNTIVFPFLIFVQIGFAQVGIGTTTPTLGYELDVEGSLLVQEEFRTNSLPNEAVEAEDKFILRQLDSDPPGEMIKMDLDAMTIAPINVVNYTFTSFPQDNLTDVNLQFDADKYVVGISNVRYVGGFIQKAQIPGSSDYTNIGNFVWRTYVDGGTWHLEIRNRALNASSNDITYHATLIIYDKKYFQELPSKSVNMEGANTGSTAIPEGL